MKAYRSSMDLDAWEKETFPCQEQMGEREDRSTWTYLLERKKSIQGINQWMNQIPVNEKAGKNIPFLGLEIGRRWKEELACMVR